MVRRFSFAGHAGRVATRIAVTGLLLCVPMTGLDAVAAASALRHPQDDWAGSQIALHEDLARSGVTRQNEPTPQASQATVPGLDVSSHQGSVNWAGVAAGGGAFAYVKATESTTYVNPSFSQQYDGSYAAGLTRGAYHFATPNTSDAVSQADWFVNHGGGWQADGRTLPPALDLEYNPYGDACYGMPPAALVAWAHAFSDRVLARTGRYPAIYTSTSWWAKCMGGDASFGARNPLWIARYNTVVGALPPGWAYQTFWQFSDTGAFPGDQDQFNGSPDQLRRVAVG